MQLENAKVMSVSRLTSDYRLLVLECPRIASAVKPGQFVHLRVPGPDAFTLRRPFSVFKADERTISIFYKRVGRGTRAMDEMGPGDPVSLLGPLGTSFPVDHGNTFPVLVAGGYGIAALYLLAKSSQSKGILFAGGRTGSEVLCTEEFAALGWQVRIATDDGSLGQKGLVTDALDKWIAGEGAGLNVEFYACGPDGMLEAVAVRATRDGRQAWISLDRHMGCGVGACLACVQKLRGDDGVERLGRVCRDGPVFECRKVVWRK